MADEILYEHRRLIPPSVMFMTGAVGSLIIFGAVENFPMWVELWWLQVLSAVFIWTFWFIVGRGADRAVKVDTAGLWVDDELVVEAHEIRGLSTRVGDEDTRHIHAATRKQMHMSLWSQASYVVIHEEPTWSHAAAATRERDLARGTWLNGVMVATSAFMGPGMREAWYLASYRSRDLYEALQRIAPQAEGPHAPDAARGTAD